MSTDIAAHLDSFSAIFTMVPVPTYNLHYLTLDHMNFVIKILLCNMTIHTRNTS